jgi:hypothetical protein
MPTLRTHLDVRALALAMAACLTASCGGGGDAPGSQTTDDPAADQAAAQSAAAAVEPAKACSLLTKAEVEAATGRTTLDPIAEDMAEFSSCAFGDPDSPMLGGRPIGKIVSISVMSGSTGYYAGPLEQVREVFDMAAKNAGGVEEVSGLGDAAHWAAGTLRVRQGPYMIDLEVDSEKDDRAISEQLVRTALGRLPKA